MSDKSKFKECLHEKTYINFYRPHKELEDGTILTGDIRCRKCEHIKLYMWNKTESSGNFEEFKNHSEAKTISIDATDSYDVVSKKVKKILDKVDLDK